MSLITLYGINASGKDTIANSIKSRISEVFVTTETRILMYILGLIDDYDASCPVSKDVYKRLENTPQNVIIKITDNEYKKTLTELQEHKSITLLLSHLVYALFIDREKPMYLTNINLKIPRWFRTLCDGFIYIRSKPSDVLKRREADVAKGRRDRGNMSLSDIVEHQSLCDRKWGELTNTLSGKRHTIVVNNDLSEAITETERFIKQFVNYR